MPGMSIHVVDVARRVVAVGMAAEVAIIADTGARRVIASGRISGNGTLDQAALATTLEAGRYQAVFQVSDYYRRRVNKRLTANFLNQELMQHAGIVAFCLQVPTVTHDQLWDLMGNMR